MMKMWRKPEEWRMAIFLKTLNLTNRAGHCSGRRGCRNPAGCKYPFYTANGCDGELLVEHKRLIRSSQKTGYNPLL